MASLSNSCCICSVLNILQIESIKIGCADQLGPIYDINVVEWGKVFLFMAIEALSKLVIATLNED